MTRRFVAALAACLGAAGLAAGTAAAAPDLKLLKDGELRVASDIPYAPFEFTRPGSSQVVGFDVDLTKAAAATFGVKKVTFVKQRFDTILLAVAQNRFDMAASSVSITDKRKRVVSFSAPYFVARQSIMVRKGSDLRTLKDLEGKKVGAQRGTTGADLAATIKGADVQRYEIVDDAFNALSAGRVEAVINDFPISAYAAARKPSLKVVAQVGAGEGYGLVFAKDRGALRDAFNRGIATVTRNGTYARIYRKWFGSAPPRG